MLWLKRGLLAVALLVVLGFVGWVGAGRGWWGSERDAGLIRGNRLPERILAARALPQSPRPAGNNKQILFGDLHVHTTWSTDAFQWSLPINGGTGHHPIADACDFARYCSSLDFWAITDHAESITPLRWQRTKDAMRQCQAKAGDDKNPDLVSFVGFEWSQVGRTPADHYGHKNVIFRDLADDKISARPIAASGVVTQVLRTMARGLPPGTALADALNAGVYMDFNTFIKKVQAVPDCAPDVPSDRLPPNCYEQASTPGELVRRLEEQRLAPLIIPHGSSWGFYTPPGTSWSKSLAPGQRPEAFPLIEVYSGHGNSEEYRPWRDIILSADGQSAVCPPPTRSYLPSCWRAGEIIKERCLKAGSDGAECDKRAEAARLAYANMSIAGHLAVRGADPEAWLDSGQCIDCFLPPFNHRPQASVQYGLAITRFDDAVKGQTRFRWGFIGASDNHRARPGTGYKPVDRRKNTEAAGPISEEWRRRMLGPPQAQEAVARPIPREQLQTMPGFQQTEFERQGSFFLTGGLAAVHAPARAREAIWDALVRREVYATSGQRMLLWFDHIDGQSQARTPMGATIVTKEAPTFEVRALGSFKQKPGCPDFGRTGLDHQHLRRLCSGECYHPSDERQAITRIEVVRIRPQARPDEPVDGLIEDKFLVHQCPPSPDGCTIRFSDPDYAQGGRDALYYVRAIQAPEPMINADPLQCVRDAEGRCVKVKLCYGDYRSGVSECTAPAEPRAWSSPIYLDHPDARRR
jgi:hypothetical protein